jgi:hypothetical protein
MFGTCLVRISVGTSEILIDVFCGFPLSQHAIIEIVHRLEQNNFLPNSPSIHPSI